MKAQPTPANLKRKSELVIEKARKGDWSAVARIIGGSPLQAREYFMDTNSYLEGDTHPDDR